MASDDLLRPPVTAARIAPPTAGPQARVLDGGALELTSVTAEDAEKALAELRELGVTVPAGFVPRLVEARHDPAAWHRDAQGQDAVTRPVVRRRWLFDLPAPSLDVHADTLRWLRERRTPVGHSPWATGALVIGLADLQLGKTGPLGGTRELLERVSDKLGQAVELARETRPAEIVMVDLGDGCENVENVAGQLATNDLSFPDQLDAFNAITLRALTDLADVAPVRFIAVPSNHMQERKNRERIGTALDDFGILNARMINRALTLAGRTDITVTIPEPHQETLTVDIAGLRVGFAHGHGANRADQIPLWWVKQSFGQQPLASAELLVTGHFHHLRVQQIGPRTWIQAPTLDNGSAWFESISGESSVPGLLTFTVTAGKWDDLHVL